MIGLNIKSKTITFLEENITESFYNLGLSRFFFSQDTKSTNQKKKRIKLDFIKMKNFFFQKILLTNENTAMHQEKIYVKHILDKGIVSRIQKKLTTQENNNLIFKMGKRFDISQNKKYKWQINT